MNTEKILIIGFGKMGRWFASEMSQNHTVKVLDTQVSPLEKTHPFQFINHPREIKEFDPHLVINAVNLQHTRAAFESVIPYLDSQAVLSDITSIKNGMEAFYKNSKRRYVSSHPMFGPTFGNMQSLKKENAIIIESSDMAGKEFFSNFYSSLGINIHYTGFEEHDQLMGESLSLPFLTTLIFGLCNGKKNIPGTTHQKHLSILQGLLSEDNELLTEVLLNPYTVEKIKHIKKSLDKIQKFVEKRGKLNLITFIEKIKNQHSTLNHTENVLEALALEEKQKATIR